MKKTIKAISNGLAMITIGIGILSSCISNPDSPGFEYMPDMYRSPAIEPYVDYGWIKERHNEELSSRQSAMHPPVHAIPFYGNIDDLEIYLPYYRKAPRSASKTHGLYPEEGWAIDTTLLGDYEIAATDINPIKLTQENQQAIFDDGKRLYAINCVHCHGKEGDGQGKMVTNDFYAGVPDYKNLTIADGQMFFSIYYGKGMMGAHAPLLNNKEIWTLVHYINLLKDKDYGVATEEDTDSENDVATNEEEVVVEENE